MTTDATNTRMMSDRMKLDFSQFHPLDHWPASKRCMSLPGGPKNHMSLAWQYKWRDKLVEPWARIFRCSFGKHKFITWTHRSPLTDKINVVPRCNYCEATRPASEVEIEKYGREWHELFD